MEQKTHNESSCNGTGKENIEHKEYERDRNRLNELEGTAGQRIKAREYVAQKAAERYSKVYYEKEYNRIKNNVKDLMGIPYGKDLCRLQRN